MSQSKGSKLNRVLTGWPRGAIYVSSWLAEQGIRFDLLDRYRRSHWVYAVGRGAVARTGDKVDWTGGLYAIQKQLKKPIHVGGKTALEMQGYAHFLPLGKERIVWLFGPPGEKLPVWFKSHQWDVRVRYVATNLFVQEAKLGLTQKDMGTFAISISAPERAIMEALYLVPFGNSFEGASLLMEGLTTLRPSLIQTLLERCHSFKVKRLFMFLAEKHKHPWAGKLDLSKVDFGKGKRVIVTGGQLNTKYKITVPT